MPIQASAPAKIILFGEHAAVYGQPAIAAPLPDMRVTLSVLGENPAGYGLTIHNNDSGNVTHIPPSSEHDPLHQMLNVILDHLALPHPDLKVRLETRIPIASGLGSGAAIATAFTRLLCAIHQQPADNDRINNIVYHTEQIHHGTPSGIDNTVIVYEQPVYFIRDQTLETLTINQPFVLLVADTGQPAPTKIAVGDVRKLYEASPTLIQPVLNEIGALTNQARTIIETGQAQQLGSLMQQNHHLLQKLTVSSPALDRLVEAAIASGADGAKLSGGGRGGNMIALVTTHNAEKVCAALYNAGAAHVYQTTVSM